MRGTEALVTNILAPRLYFDTESKSVRALLLRLSVKIRKPGSISGSPLSCSGWLRNFREG